MSKTRIPNEYLLSDVPRSNLLTNGGFEINQRGLGATNVNNAYWSDRWFMNWDAGIGGSGYSNNGAPAGGLHGLSSNALFMQCIGTGQLRATQKIENWAVFKGIQLSFSAWVWADTANIARIAVNDGVTITYSSYHPGDSTWRQLTVTVTTSPTTTTLEARCTNEAVSASVYHNAYWDNAMLVIGSVPVDYIPLTPAEEWARCLRYYQRWNNNTAEYIDAVGAAGGTTGGYVFLPLQAPMGGVPILTVSAVGNWSAVNGSFATAFVCTSFALQQAKPMGVMINAVIGSASLVGAQPMFIQANANGSWLALEWNP